MPTTSPAVRYLGCLLLQVFLRVLDWFCIYKLTGHVQRIGWRPLRTASLFQPCFACSPLLLVVSDCSMHRQPGCVAAMYLRERQAHRDDAASTPHQQQHGNSVSAIIARGPWKDLQVPAGMRHVDLAWLLVMKVLQYAGAHVPMNCLNILLLPRGGV